MTLSLKYLEQMQPGREPLGHSQHSFWADQQGIRVCSGSGVPACVASQVLRTLYHLQSGVAPESVTEEAIEVFEELLCQVDQHLVQEMDRLQGFEEMQAPLAEFRSLAAQLWELEVGDDFLDQLNELDEWLDQIKNHQLLLVAS